MLVIATPPSSLIRAMWYSNGPGYDSKVQPKSELQNSRPLPVSSAGISRWTMWPTLDMSGLCGALELVDLDLPHAEHRLHHALRLLGIGVTEQLRQHARHDLPGESEPVLQPSARA